MKKLVLDAGHYLETPGKRTPNGVREWTLNNAVCKYIAEYLKNYKVEIHRVDDTAGKKEIKLAERVNKTNKINPDAFVSIHHNAYNGKWNSVTGTEVYHHTQGSAKDKELAKLLAPKVAKETGLKNRGVKKAEFAVLTCKASIPAVLCEGGFMDSKTDEPIITSEKGQRAYAKAVADGIISFLKLEKKEEPKKLTTAKIDKMSIKLKIDANLWDLTFTNAKDAKSVKKYKKGDVVGNIVAIATHPCGSKYYMTEYSYNNNVLNGFNVVDCEKYEERTKNFKCSYCGNWN